MTAAEDTPEALSSPSSIESQPRRGWKAGLPGRSFWVFFTASALFALAFSSYFFLYSVYLVELNFSESQIGRITAALTLGSMLGTLPAGMLVRRAGIRCTVICCIAISAAASALRICLSGYDAQIALGLIAGFTLCAWAVCLGPSVASLCSEKTRTFAFSAIFASGIAVTGVGTLLSSHAAHLLKTAVPNMHLSMLDAHRAVALIACAAGALSVLPLSLLPLGKVVAPREKIQTIYPFLRRFLPAAALWTFASAAFAPFVTVFFTRRHGISVQQLGLFLSSSQIAQAAGVLLAPLMLKRFGFGRSMMMAQVAATCALALLAAAKVVILIEVLYWMFLAFTCVSEPCLYSILMAGVSANQRGAASSAHQLVAGFTVTLAAIVTGSIISRFGYPPMFVVLAACTIASAAMFRRLGRTANRTPLLAIRQSADVSV